MRNFLYIMLEILIGLVGVALIGALVYLFFVLPIFSLIPIVTRAIIAASVILGNVLTFASTEIIHKLTLKKCLKKNKKLDELMKNGHILTEQEQKYREKFAKRNKRQFKNYIDLLHVTLNKFCKYNKGNVIFSIVNDDEEKNITYSRFKSRSMNKTLDMLENKIKEEIEVLNSRFYSNYIGIGVIWNDKVGNIKLVNGDIAKEDIKYYNNEIHNRDYYLAQFKFNTEQEADELLKYIDKYRKKIFSTDNEFANEEDEINKEYNRLHPKDDGKLKVNLAHNKAIVPQEFKSATSSEKNENKNKYGGLNE